MVSNPVDKLIEDMEQQRAKEYWERIERFKAQEEEQKESREAHEQRQLEYMRSAGIDLKKFERDEEEDARNLKSDLEQKRPPLISRPVPVPDVHIPPIAGGWMAPPYKVFGTPPDPGVVQPSDPSQIKIKDVDDGSGLGWGATGRLGSSLPYADVWFFFVPHQDASYTFTAWLAFHGFYILQADDGFLTNKSAEVTATLSLQAVQFVARTKQSGTVFDYQGDNIHEFKNFDHFVGISDTQDFRAGALVWVTARIEVEAIASGGGSHAEVNFEDGDANFIQPLGLWVSPIP